MNASGQKLPPSGGVGGVVWARRTSWQDPKAGMRGLPARKELGSEMAGCVVSQRTDMKGAAARGGLHLFGQAAVLAAASMLLAPACAQTITVQGTENVTVTIGQPTVFYTKTKGNGTLVKHGNGELDLRGVTVGNFRGRIRLKEGAVLIEQDRNLGQNEEGKKQAGLILSGGTLSFLNQYFFTVTLGVERLITVPTEKEGTFNTRGGDVKVNSTLVGSGLLKKTGSGDLDFRNVQASLFTGAIRMEEGSLLIDEGRDLGGTKSLILSGGTLSFLSPLDGYAVTVGPERMINVEDAGGIFDIRSSEAHVKSTLVGSGLLRITGYGYLDFSKITVNWFTGTLRIEEGSLKIDESKDLGGRGGRKSVLELAGGKLELYKMTTALSSERQIIISEDSAIVGGDPSGFTTVTINSTISVKKNKGVTLTFYGRIELGGNNYIENMYIGGAVTGDTASLGGDVAKTVRLADYLTLNQDQETTWANEKLGI